jgi:hypothetical protein
MYRAFDQQTIHYNEVLKKTQEDHEAARSAMQKATSDQNQILSKEKRDTDMRQRVDWAE